MLWPSHLLIRDHATRSIVLAVRGTHSVKVRCSVQARFLFVLSLGWRAARPATCCQEPRNSVYRAGRARQSLCEGAPQTLV